MNASSQTKSKICACTTSAIDASSGSAQVEAEKRRALTDRSYTERRLRSLRQSRAEPEAMKGHRRLPPTHREDVDAAG